MAAGLVCSDQVPDGDLAFAHHHAINIRAKKVLRREGSVVPAHEDGKTRSPLFEGCGNIPGLVDVDGEGAVDPAEIGLEFL